MARIRILIVEDEEPEAKLIYRKLKHLGYDVIGIASSGEVAVEKVSETHPDLVLMDIMLEKNKGGIDAAEKIRNRFKIPVVFITGYEDEEILHRAKITVPFGYLFKPIQERELRTAIEVALFLADADRKLRESEERYHQLVELSPDAIIVTDLEGKILMVNKQALRLYGCKKEEELVRKNSFDFISPEDQENAVKNAKKVLDTGIIRNVEYNLLKKDGHTYPVELSTSLIKDAEDKPAAFIGIVRDISEKKEAEEALRASQEYAKNIINSSMDMIIAVDNKRRIMEFNKAAEEAFGYSREEVLGKHVNFLYADPKEGLRVHKETVKHGRHVQEIFNRRKTGSVFPSLLCASVLRDSQGNKVGVMGISRDITEQKRAEEIITENQRKLEEAHSLLSAIIENTPMVATQGYDRTGKVTFWNKASEELYGISADEAVGKRLGELILSESVAKEFEELMTEILESGNPTSIREWTTTSVSGGTRYVLSSLFPVKYGKGKTQVICMDIDITERKQAEEAAKERLEELEKFYKVTVGREIRMVELKKKIKELENQLAEKDQS